VAASVTRCRASGQGDSLHRDGHGPRPSFAANPIDRRSASLFDPDGGLDEFRKSGRSADLATWSFYIDSSRTIKTY
jgi:hypothetical protein